MMSKNKRAYTALGVVLAAIASVALAGTFNLFSPATGILKGSSGTYVTTAANSADVLGLWTGTCNSGTFLRGDGLCAAAGSGTVTSVALTMPGIFSVSGSPVITSGTLGVTASGTSGGIPYFDSATTLASSAALAANQIVLGGGAGATPATLGSLGTTTTVLHGNAAGAPSFSAVSLSADVTGTLADGSLSINVALLNGGQNFSVAPTITAKNICLADGTNCPAASDTSGTYTATLSTGCTTTPTATAKWVKNGHLVTINFGNFGTCTSNSTITSLDASVPASERPASNQCLQVISVEDNTVLSHALARVLTSGVIDFGLDGASGGNCGGAGWTSSGTKSLGQGFTITFQTAN